MHIKLTTNCHVSQSRDNNSPLTVLPNFTHRLVFDLSAQQVVQVLLVKLHEVARHRDRVVTFELANFGEDVGQSARYDAGSRAVPVSFKARAHRVGFTAAGLTGGGREN